MSYVFTDDAALSVLPDGVTGSLNTSQHVATASPFHRQSMVNPLDAVMWPRALWQFDHHVAVVERKMLALDCPWEAKALQCPQPIQRFLQPDLHRPLLTVSHATSLPALV